MMSRTAATLLCVVFIGASTLSAQVHPTRSTDYLSTAGVSDVRSNWVNPAGLGALPEASVMGEITVGRTPADEMKFEQFALGFNSRGMSVVYVRNRFPDPIQSTTMLRLATALPMARGAIGFAATLYGAPGDNDRGYDVGLQYALTPAVTTGAVLRNIGRPMINGPQLPLQIQGGALLSMGGGSFRLSTDAIGTEDLINPQASRSLSDYTMAYLAGGSLDLPLRYPLRLSAMAHLGSNFRVDRLHVGVGIGGRTHVAAYGTGVSRNNSPAVDRVSLVGVSSNVLAGR